MSQNNEITKNIFAEALDISANSKVDIFFSYSPHVKQIEVRVYLNGWDFHKEHNFYEAVYVNDTEMLEELLENVKYLRDEI